jgi:hypothetical protein
MNNSRHKPTSSAYFHFQYKAWLTVKEQYSGGDPVKLPISQLGYSAHSYWVGFANFKDFAALPITLLLSAFMTLEYAMIYSVSW